MIWNFTAAFEDFLQTFKTTPTTAITDALGGMNIDQDDLSDEYDFMDDDDNEGQNARRQTRSQSKMPKLKYLDLLQKVADRYEDEITIDLDDVAKVDLSGSEDVNWTKLTHFYIGRPAIRRERNPDEAD